jgi:DnaJ like chaperone protein
MLIIIRLFRFLVPILLGYLLLRVVTGMLSGRNFQGSGPRSTPPPGNRPSRDPYEVLGCSPRDPDEKIKKAYRKLVARNHPDKFSGLDLDKEFTEFAARRFQEIQEAYEKIRKARGFV